MRASADTIGNRENMILAIIRRFNAGIVKFVMSIKFRSVGAMLLSSFAGLSLTTTIIPSAMEFSGTMDSFSARWGLGGYAVYSMMAWAVGGWAVQRTGDKKLGAIVLGFVGLVTGLLFTGVGLGTELNLFLTGGGAGLLYGAVGGMIIGDALRDPPADPNDPYASVGRIGDLGIFSYFKNQR
ncbi:MAG: hypothetical protein PHY09_13650 [Desulfuromonadaceae bacterium]|nr:hypothetical protein [Desulfuromonadaceae bacterium]MDD5105794.1 hypothetical protein [Desulfuromonadaceae bacterium]